MCTLALHGTGYHDNSVEIYLILCTHKIEGTLSVVMLKQSALFWRYTLILELRVTMALIVLP